MRARALKKQQNKAAFFVVFSQKISPSENAGKEPSRIAPDILTTLICICCKKYNFSNLFVT